MDLEEELSLLHEDLKVLESRPDQQSESQEKNNEEQDHDLLGLDEHIKLSTRTKIAKVDNERIFDKNRGVPYVVCNYKSVTRVMKSNDKRLANTIASHPEYSSRFKKQLKIDNEFDNLDSIIQFYQLWCHRMFPKARFRDCLHLVRSLGAKSSPLKLYRREMIEIELQKLKAERGIIDEHIPSNVTESIIEENGENPDKMEEKKDMASESFTNVLGASNEDDDWSFMNKNKSSGLFVDMSDEDLYGNPSERENSISQLRPHADLKSKSSHTKSDNDSGSHNENHTTDEAGKQLSDSEDPFSDDEGLNVAERSAKDQSSNGSREL